MDFSLLGPFEATIGGRRLDLGRRRERLILAVLLLETGRFVALDRLTDLLWDGAAPEGARAAVYTAVARLRRQFGPYGLKLLTRGEGYQVDVAPECVDAHRFARMVTDARASKEPDETAALLTEALALWRGPLLADTASDRIRERLGARLHELRLVVIEGRADANLDSGRPDEVVADLSAEVDAHPTRELLTELLMTALYRTGRQADALAAYHLLRRRLADDLGIEPSPRLRSLHERMLRQDPALTTGSWSPAGAGERPAKAEAEPGAGDRPDRPFAPVPAQLPADVAAFAGRRAELARLDDVLRDRHPTAVSIVVVTGTAGVGKTALAVHWAHRIRDEFPDGQVYLDLRGYDPAEPPLDAGEASRALLVALETPPSRIPADVPAQIGLLRTLLSDRRILVLIDNVRNAEQVRHLLPGSAACLVVITSRDPLAGIVATHGAVPVPLDVLNGDEARELLARRLGAVRVLGEPDAVADLVDRCARLPLALAIVSARAATRPTPTLRALADELADWQRRLAALDAGDDAASVQAVFTWSYDAVGAEAAHLFRLVAMVPGPDISVAAASSLVALPREQVRVLVDDLIRGGLVTARAPERFALHDLLRAFGQQLARRHEAGSTLAAARHRLLDHYRHGAHIGTLLLDPHRQAPQLPVPRAGTIVPELSTASAAVAWFDAEHTNLIAMVRLAAETGPHAHSVHLAWAMATHLARRGHWHEWASLGEVAVAAARAAGEPADQATAHKGLAAAYAVLGRFDDAHEHYVRAIELFAELGDDVNLARIHHDYCWVFDRESRWSEAIDHLQQALRLDLARGNRAGVARAHNAIGCMHAKLGNHPLALTHCLQAVALFREVDDPAGEASTWDSLGLIHHRTGGHDEATTCLQRALHLHRGSQTRLAEAETLHLMGDNYAAAGAREDARAAWTASAAILTDLGRPEAPQVLAKLREP
jgi:DNA-binding SARP family transcriptional activator/tetratricopeptide (TPR) repeat protein